MKKKYLIIGVVLLLIIGIGITYAYFTGANLDTEEETTITVKGGSIKIVYASGSDILADNIIPGDNPIVTKVFTLTGTNTTTLDVDMGYEIVLIVNSNTFNDDSITYKMTSVNNDSNGEVAQSITESLPIETGAVFIL